MQNKKMRYLDPKNDLTFKRIFGEHPHLLKSFLNAVLPLAVGRKIESLEYLPAELTPQVPLFKYTIVDVRCTDNMGRQFIVEMQMLWTDSFKSRVLFNASKAYVKQLEKGEKYHSLQAVYALSLVNQNFEPHTEAHYHHYQIVNVGNPKQQLEGLEFVFVELPKLKAKNLKEKALGVLWLRFLAEIENRTEQVSEDFFAEPDLREALEYLAESAFTREELDVYDKYWDSIIAEQTLIEDAERKGRIDGKMEGKMEGRIEGKIEGRIEGRIEGKMEGKIEGKMEGAIETARKMKRKGFLPNDIAELTGLSIEDIDVL